MRTTKNLKRKLRSVETKLKHRLAVLGTKNPNYRHGTNCEDKKYFCTVCGKRVGYPNVKCKSCCRLGIKFSEQHRRNMAKSKLGDKNPVKCKLVRGKISETLKRKWDDPTFIARFTNKLQKINKSEERLFEFLKYLFGSDYEYVGDGKYWITRFNPDFVNPRKKLIIELFGDYWHKRPGSKKRDVKRTRVYGKYGYRTLVVWEHELSHPHKLMFKLYWWHHLYNHKFYQNVWCEFFPCHKNVSVRNFSCMLCFCPLYPYNCGGNFTMTKDGKKDCSDCTIPHTDYDFVIDFLTNKKEQKHVNGTS